MTEEPIVPVVIDTNLLVPSLYSTTRIAHFLCSGNLLLIWNDFIYNEYIRIINKLSERYLRKAGVHHEEIITLLDVITRAGYRVPEMPDNWQRVCRHRNGDNFFWAAMIG